MVLYMIIYETPEKTCWYYQGISALSLQFGPGTWNIVSINTTNHTIKPLTQSLLHFFKRCRAWAQGSLWSRGLRRLRERELLGRAERLCPSHSPQWRSLSQQPFLAAEEVAGSIFLHGRLQRPSRMLPGLSVRPETRQDPEQGLHGVAEQLPTDNALSQPNPLGQ
jgi:hypothetical protein